MNRAAVRLLNSLAVAVLAVASIPTFAAVQRTFVASNGLDTNPCSLALPCQSFGTAIVATTAGGEVIVLDSAGYGPVTITQAVSIIAPAGIYAGVTAASAGNGITINAPGAAVVLRGLEINGLGVGASGILHQAGAGLVVDRCTVTGFSGAGISINAGPATITDTVSKNNGGGGIVVHGTDPVNFVRVTIVRSRVEANGGPTGFPTDAGVASLGGSIVTVEDSVAVGHLRGFSACNSGGGEPLGGVLSVDRSLSSRNAVGVFSGPNAVLCSVRVSNSTITDNTVLGMEAQGGGVITSLGNNFVFNNAGGETFGLTVSPK